MKINETALAKAVVQFELMTIMDKLNILDEIGDQQPHMLCSILVQSQFGSTMENIEDVLKILIVLHMALKNSKIKIQEVSPSEIDREIDRFIANVNFTKGLPDSIEREAIKKYTTEHNEKYSFVFAYSVLAESGIMFSESNSSQLLVLAGLNLVNCIASAKEI
jgi:hypothetical protein